MRSESLLLKVILALALVGILTSGWLLSTHIRFATGQASLTESCSLVPGGSQGCANVAVSSYSDVFGIPLAAIALGYYFCLALLVFWAWRNYQMANEPLYVSFFLSSIAVVVTVIMFSLSRFVLKQFCIGCSILWVVNLLVWPALAKQLSLSWAEAPLGWLELLRSKKVNLTFSRVKGAFVVGFVCVFITSVMGMAAKSQGAAETKSDAPSLVAEFEVAPRVVLPQEAYGGNSAKGQVQTTPVMDIVEFADFQCPGCRMAAQLLRPFVLKHSGKVRITYRNFPLDAKCNPFVPNGSHQLACLAAKSAICSGQQAKFWEMHDRIFDSQESLASNSFSEFAQSIGLDASKYQTCLGAAETEAQLQREMQWAELIQLQSTPTLVVNGRKISGARSPQEFESLLIALEQGKIR